MINHNFQFIIQQITSWNLRSKYCSQVCSILVEVEPVEETLCYIIGIRILATTILNISGPVPVCSSLFCYTLIVLFCFNLLCKDFFFLLIFMYISI